MERTERFPGLDDFLTALRLRGIPIGPHELVWLQHAFSLAPSLDRQGLKNLFACTLIKQDSHREVFESLFADWCPPDETDIAEPPERNGRQPSKDGSEESRPNSLSEPSHAAPQNGGSQSQGRSGQRTTRRILAKIWTTRRRWLIFLLLMLSAALGYYFWPPPPVVVTPPVTAVPPPPPPPTIQPALPSDPAQEFWTWVPEQITVASPSFADSVWAAFTLALLSLLSGAFLWWWYSRRSRLPPREASPGPGPTWVPLRSSEKILPELMNHDALRTAVWGVERFVSEDETTAVDVDCTVAATARAGGLPTIRHAHAVYPREVWLWRDVMVHDATVDRLLNELEGSLQRAGLPVRVGTFANTPGLIAWREGQEFSPLVLEGHRQSALVVILTDGYGLRLAAQSELEKAPLTQVLRAFGEWPRLTFVEVGDGKHGLAQYVHTYGLRCIAPQDIPSFLAAGPVSAVASQRRASELVGDLRAWAAATALSPEPVVAEDRAFTLRQRLGLDLSPWQFRDLLMVSEGAGDGISWSPARKAELLNWLTRCSTENGKVADESLLARALAYWIEQYHEEQKQRQEHENALLPWKQTLAEQRLCMERALLELWRQPEKATEELYRLYDNLKAEIRERLVLLADWGSRQVNHDNIVCLPWKESELSARTRWMLAQMGFAGRAEHDAGELRMPPRLLLALGVSTGLALVALSSAIWRLITPAMPVFQPALAEPFRTVIIRDVQRSGLNDYRIAFGTPKKLRAEPEPVPARSVIDVQWKWQRQPNMKTFGKSQLWHAGTLPQAIRGCENDWPRRSLFVLQAEPSDISARQLAIQLLDRGSADLVLLGTDWADHLDKLIQVDASLTRKDQLVLVLPPDAPILRVDFQGDFGVVRSADLNSLIAPLVDLPDGGVRLLDDVWDSTEMTGAPRVRGGPAEQRDGRTGVTFVTVCGGTFLMGSDEDKGSGEDKATQNYPDETPRHPVTLSTFEISKTEITNAQYRLFQKGYEGSDNLPVVNVSWSDAKAFCENYGYALPSEAEWEYAARGGSVTPWSFAGDEQQLGNYAWFADNSGDQGHDVGTKLPNPLGLRDMHGNVWEWVTDCYDDEAYHGRPELIVDPVVNPNVVGSCQYRVLRGGAWRYDPGLLRSAIRARGVPVNRGDDIGFRCVRRPRRQP